MKEASGELSMTAIAVVAIAAVGVIFTTLIYPNIKSSLQRQQLCLAAYGCSCDTGENATCSCVADVETAEGTISQSNVFCDAPEVD